MKNRRVVIGFLSLVVVIGLAVPVWQTGKSRINTFKENEWSIGVYTGKSPFALNSPQGLKNPVLTAADVTDAKAGFVADPFMIQKDSVWYMFFEVLNTLTNQGDIALAESRDGFHWDYRKIVLNERFHLSYPMVFKLDEEYYMIPESAEARQLRLYKANNFPYNWELDQILIDGTFGDHVVFKQDDLWWIIANSEPRTHSTTRLFWSDSLRGPYTEHPVSPIVRDDASRARPGGRVPLLEGKRFWLAQDCKPTYGRKLNAFEILKLTKDQYVERSFGGNPVLAGGAYSWTRRGMHQIDAHQLNDSMWIACVDGYKRNFFIKIEF